MNKVVANIGWKATSKFEITGESTHSLTHIQTGVKAKLEIAPMVFFPQNDSTAPQYFRMTLDSEYHEVISRKDLLSTVFIKRLQEILCHI